MAAGSGTAWVQSPVGPANGDAQYKSVVTGATDTTQTYLPVITFMTNSLNRHRHVFLNFYFPVVTGTNIDVAIYGSMTPTGTKFLLLDAPVADITTAGAAKGTEFDVNAYPAPYYWVSLIYDGNNGGNTGYVRIIVPHISL
jgi:hypothetical protein